MQTDQLLLLKSKCDLDFTVCICFEINEIGMVKDKKWVKDNSLKQ